jgi:hypothetical protein
MGEPFLINPEWTPIADPVAGPEGCLSFPEMYTDIMCPESIEVRAITQKGEPLHFRCGGLLARAIQHEHDHLDGILFTIAWRKSSPKNGKKKSTPSYIKPRNNSKKPAATVNRSPFCLSNLDEVAPVSPALIARSKSAFEIAPKGAMCVLTTNRQIKESARLDKNVCF